MPPNGDVSTTGTLTRNITLNSKRSNNLRQEPEGKGSDACPRENMSQNHTQEAQAGHAHRVLAIEEMVERHSSGLPGPASANANHKIVYSTFTVLLTGTTGSLGSEVLSLLLSQQSVEKVYAFNRRSNGKSSLVERHKQRFRSKGLDPDLLQSTKLVYVEGDTAEKHLGLDIALYELLRNSVNLIIHNAWPINLVKPLRFFEPNLLGLRNLIDMSLTSPDPARIRFLFISSMTAVQSWNWKLGPVPEEVVLDSNLSIGNGYGESKVVAERILSKSGLHSSTLRVGQICGRFSNGAWSAREWFPILVKSSLTLGVLPEAEGVVSWLPLDIVAASILEIALAKQKLPSMLNISHPRPAQWNVLIKAIFNSIIKSRRLSFNPLALSTIPFQDWFDLLETRAQNTDQNNIRDVPAVKLLEGFRHMAIAEDAILKTGRKNAEHLGFHTFSTDMAQRFSPSLRRLRSLRSDDAEQWVVYWETLGFIESHSGRVFARL